MNKETKIRGIIAVIFTAMSVLGTIAFFIFALIDGNSFLESLTASPLYGFVFGGMIPGFLHISAVNKKIKGLLIIPVAGWMIYLLLVIGIPFMGGWVFMLKDLFLYLKSRKESK